MNSVTPAKIIKPEDSLEDILKKIDLSTSRVQVLELIGAYKSIKKEAIRLNKPEQYIIDLKEDERNQDYIDGYLEAVDTWYNCISYKGYELQIRAIRLIGIEWAYRTSPKRFDEAFYNYAIEKIDVDGLFSALKTVVRNLYVPTL